MHFFSPIYLIFWESSLTKPRVHCSSWTDWPANFQNPPVSTPQLWNYKYSSPQSLIMWVLGIQTQVLLLIQQALYPLSYLPVLNLTITWTYKFPDITLDPWSQTTQDSHGFFLFCFFFFHKKPGKLQDKVWKLQDLSGKRGMNTQG